MNFKEYIAENATPDRSSNKLKAMSTLVSALKTALGQFDISTRTYAWEHITNPKGKELMEKILRNPKTYLSDSEFNKLIQKK